MANSISLALYSIRVRSMYDNVNLPIQGFDGHNDLLNEFCFFLEDYSHHSSIDEHNFKRLIISRYLNTARIIKGIVDTGDYGYESSIVDVNNDQETYHRHTNDAEMLPFYYNIILPRNTNEGLIAVQRLGQRGIKTAFHNAFSVFFNHRNPEYRVEFNEIIPDQVLAKLMEDGFIQKVRLIRFGVPKDIEDLYDNAQREQLGTTELVISARRNGNLPLLPRLREFLIGARLVTNIVEIENYEYNEVKIEFVINKKHRIINLSELDKINSFYDITEDVVRGENGHPTFESIDAVAESILHDTYVGMGILEENVR